MINRGWIFVEIYIFINVDKRIEEPKEGFIPFIGYYNEYILDILKYFHVSVQVVSGLLQLQIYIQIAVTK